MITKLRFPLFFSLMVLATFGGLPALPGCGPDVTDEDLGAVVHEIPEVPGSDQPYELPELGGAGEEAADERGYDDEMEP